MTIIKTFKGENSAFAWCPFEGKHSIIAIASKEGSISGFDENLGTLQIFDFDILGENEPKPIISVELENRVNCLIWGKTLNGDSEYPFGIIATSFNDGSISIWKPILFEDSVDLQLIEMIKISNNPIKAICFNQHKFCKELACGCQDGTLSIIDLIEGEEATVTSLTSQNYIPSEITKVCWNTKVAHILSSVQSNGHITLWDINKKAIWTELYDPNSSRISDLIWNPLDGLQLITAIESDTNPVLRLWDLRSSTSVPVTELSGHSKGILSISWCPFDDTLLLSCGKDNRILLWDLKTYQMAEEIDSVAEAKVAPQDAAMFFNNANASSVTRKTQIEWSPIYPGIACASSTDRSLTLYNISSPGSHTLHRAPKWIQRPAGVSFGFGGKLVMFNDQTRQVDIVQLTPDSELIEESKDFEEAMNTGDMKGLCMRRCESNKDEAHKDMWNFMNCMFDEDARDSLVHYLGYSQRVCDTIYEENEEQTQDNSTEIVEEKSAVVEEPPKMSLPPISAEELFSKPLDITSTPSTEVSSSGLMSSLAITSPSSPVGSIMSGVSNIPVAPSTPKESISSELASVKEVEDITWINSVKLAIICGNFESAVDICFKNKRYGDALLIASWGEPELLLKTQNRYMNEYFPVSLRSFSSIVHGDLSPLVQNTNLDEWKDTLVLILTYGKTEEFIVLCQHLSSKLEENNYLNEALLCSICAMDLPSVVRIGLKANLDKNINELVPVLEVISILTHMQQEGGEPLPELSSNLIHNVVTLCTSLANQGLVSMATRFIRSIGSSEEGELLLYRIYQSYPEALNGYIPHPNVPQVNSKPVSTQTTKVPTASTASTVPTTASSSIPSINQMMNQQQVHPSMNLPIKPASMMPTQPSAPMSMPVNRSIPSTRPTQPTTSQFSRFPPSMIPSQMPSMTPGMPMMPSSIPSTNPSMSLPTSGMPTPFMPSQPISQVPAIPATNQYPVVPLGPQSRTPAPVDISRIKGTPYVPANIPVLNPLNPTNGMMTAPKSEPHQLEPEPEPEPVIRELTSDELSVIESINQTISFLEQVNLSVAQKTVVSGMVTAVGYMKDQFKHSEISEEALQYLMSLSEYLNNYNYSEAYNIFKKLNQEYWKQYKDWLLGLKHFLMLCMKLGSGSN